MSAYEEGIGVTEVNMEQYNRDLEVLERLLATKCEIARVKAEEDHEISRV